MDFDSHDHLGDVFEDLITQLVGERAVLVGGLRLVAAEDFDVPQHVGVSVLAEDDEPVAGPRLVLERIGFSASEEQFNERAKKALNSLSIPS